jgi:hypothetical protein
MGPENDFSATVVGITETLKILAALATNAALLRNVTLSIDFDANVICDWKSIMIRTGVEPIWRLRRSTGRGEKVVVPLTPRLLIDDMLSLKQAAIGGLGLVALPGYVCRDDLKSGVLRQVLPDWIADDSTLTALIAYRQGLLPSVRAFIDHLAAELPMSVLI